MSWFIKKIVHANLQNACKYEIQQDTEKKTKKLFNTDIDF